MHDNHCHEGDPRIQLVAELADGIRRQVAWRRDAAEQGDAVKALRPRLDWNRLTVHLDHAERHAPVGCHLPSWDHRGRLRRYATRFVARAVLKLIARDPEDRYQSADEALAALSQA